MHVLRISLFCATLAVLSCLVLASSPSSFVIKGVPTARQDTDYYCGEASLQILLEYYHGVKIPQDKIGNVARANPEVGTLSKNIVRALRFSRLSFPASSTDNTLWGPGYPGVESGLSAFAVSLSQPWLKLLQETIAKSFPVIVLQAFALDDPGGHFRVAYGYNATHVFVKDPWGRDGYQLDYAMPNAVFLKLWKYLEPGLRPSMAGARYWGASATHWSLAFTQRPGDNQAYGKDMGTEFASSATSNSTVLSVHWKYESPFPTNLIEKEVGMDKVLVELDYNRDIWAPDWDSKIVTPTLYPGYSGIEHFKFQCITSLQTCQQDPMVQVRVSAVINGAVPATYRTNTTSYSAYQYMDLLATGWSGVKIQI